MSFRVKEKKGEMEGLQALSEPSSHLISRLTACPRRSLSPACQFVPVSGGFRESTDHRLARSDVSLLVSPFGTGSVLHSGCPRLLPRRLLPHGGTVEKRSFRSIGCFLARGLSGHRFFRPPPNSRAHKLLGNSSTSSSSYTSNLEGNRRHTHSYTS